MLQSNLHYFFTNSLLSFFLCLFHVLTSLTNSTEPRNKNECVLSVKQLMLLFPRLLSSFNSQAHRRLVLQVHPTRPLFSLHRCSKPLKRGSAVTQSLFSPQPGVRRNDKSLGIMNKFKGLRYFDSLFIITLTANLFLTLTPAPASTPVS